MKERYHLFTNLDYVVLRGVRTHCHALVLQQVAHHLGVETYECRVRGFGADASSEVFDISHPTTELDFEVVPAQSNQAAFIKANGTVCPLSTGSILRIGVLELQLHAHDSSKPICQDPFEAEQDQRVVLKVWRKLRERVAEFWIHPAMPVVGHHSPQLVLRVLRENPDLD